MIDPPASRSSRSPARPIRAPSAHRIARALGVALCLAGCVATAPRPAAPLPTIPPPPPAAEIAPVFYTLMVEAHDLGADVFLNDVLVESLEPAERAILASGVNLWVVPGENRLRVRSRGEKPPAGGPQTMKVQVGRRNPEGSGAPEVLADLALAPQPPAVGFDQTCTFVANPAPPAELWVAAQPLTLDAATRAEGTRLARALEWAFLRRDVDGVTALLEWKVVDSARAAFREAGQAREAQRETLENLFADEGYVVDHFTPEALEFELCGGGRLLKVSRPSGPALQARLSQGGRFRLPLLLANIGGTLRIVR